VQRRQGTLTVVNAVFDGGLQMSRFLVLLVVGTALTLGYAPQAAADDDASPGVVTLQCETGLVHGSKASSNVNVTLPVPGTTCAQAVADLLASHLKLVTSFDVAGTGPFFLFETKH